MRHTGIIRTVDSLGRIVIPVELRNSLELKTGDPVEILVEHGRIILQKFAPSCIFCDSNEELLSFCGKPVCKNCIRYLGTNCERSPSL